MMGCVYTACVCMVGVSMVSVCTVGCVCTVCGYLRACAQRECVRAQWGCVFMVCGGVYA